MPLIIPDETLQAAKMTEHEARVEIACSLFAAGKLDLWPAAQLAALSRDEFVAELHRRGIGWPRYDVDDYAQDLASLDKVFGRKESA